MSLVDVHVKSQTNFTVIFYIPLAFNTY